MNNLKQYDDFVNEEISKKSILTMAVPIIMGAGALSYQQSCTHKGVADFDKVKVINSEEFKQYDLSAKGESFTLTIKGSFITAHHSYTTSSGSGKHRHTHTHTFDNLMIPKGTKFIWYKSQTFGGVYASPKPFKDAHLLKMSDLKLYKEEKGYSIYKVKGWFPAFNYVVIINEASKIDGEKYELSDNKLGYYVCHKVNRDLYIFATSAGYGAFGGGGAGSEF